MSDVAGSAVFAESLREAHETYRHLVEGIPAVLYIDANDEASTNIFTSPQVEAMLGFPPRVSVGTSGCGRWSSGQSSRAGGVRSTAHPGSVRR